MITQKSIKKIFSPLIHALGTLVGLAVLIVLLGLAPRFLYDCDQGGCVGIFDQYPTASFFIHIGLFFVPFVVFIGTNFIINFVEKNPQPKLLDHIRQSSLLYFSIIFVLILNLVTRFFRGGPGWIGLLSMYTFVAIVINAMYLIAVAIKNRKKNV